MARDYAQEYANRVALERHRAEVEHRAPELGRARGHKDPQIERTRSRLRYWTTRNAQVLGMPREDYQAAVESAVAMSGGDHQAEVVVLALLRNQGRGLRDPSTARDLWNNRPLFLPIELFYYHAGEGGGAESDTD
jgi:hypothetical protein